MRPHRVSEPSSWSDRGPGSRPAGATCCGAPAISLAYGVLFAVFGWAVTIGLWWLHMIYLILPLTAGFLIMGPILAVGLYEVSRRRQRGEAPTFAAALAAYRVNSGQIALIGVTLLLLFFAWTQLAVMIFFMFFGLRPPSLADFVRSGLLLGGEPAVPDRRHRDRRAGWRSSPSASARSRSRCCSTGPTSTWSRRS